MKIKIDTTAKTIAIEEAVNIDQLIRLVKGLFPDDWRQWKLETNVKFEMPAAPIIIREREVRPYWENPFWYGSGTCGTSITNDGTSSNAVQFFDYRPDWIVKTQAGTNVITS